MRSSDSKEFYEAFLNKLKEMHISDRVKGNCDFKLDGEFGAMMSVEIINDGPVTFLLDSKDRG